MAIITNADNLTVVKTAKYKDVDEAIAILQNEGFAPKKYVDEVVASQISIVNVLDFDADNSGFLDSSKSIQDAMDYAEQNGIRRVYAPSGNYLLRSTIYIPSEIEFFGDGMEKTFFTIDDQSVLDSIKMFDESEHNLNTYITPISTKTSRNGIPINNILLKDFKISDIIYDNTNIVGVVCPILILNTNDSKLENLHFGSVQTSGEQTSNERISTGCSIVFSNNILLEKCVHEFAGYESLSIRCLSKNITSYKNLFYIDKPTNLNRQLHACQVARPTQLVSLLESEYGESKVDGYTSYLDIFLLKGNVEHAFTSHASNNSSVINARVIANREDDYTFYIFKIFDQSVGVEISGCNIDLINEDRIIDDGRVRAGVIGIGSTAYDVDSETKDVIVTNNLINIKDTYPASAGYRDYASLIGNTLNEFHNSIISNNIINVDGYNNSPFHAIGVYGNNNVVSGNLINFTNPEVAGDTKAVGILMYGGSDNNIYGNVITGENYNGIKIMGVKNVVGLILNGNSISTSISKKVDIAQNINKGVSQAIISSYLDLTGEGFELKSPDGTPWRVTVDNDGSLVTEEIN